MEGTILKHIWILCVPTGFASPGANLHAPNEAITVDAYIKGIKYAAAIMDRLRAFNAEVRTLLEQAKASRDIELTLKVLTRAEMQLALEAKLLSEQPVLERQVAEMLQIKMVEALIRLKTRFGDDPALLREIFSSFKGDEPAGHAAFKSLPN